MKKKYDQYAVVIGVDVDAKKWIKENAEEVEYKPNAGTKPLRVRMNGEDQYFKTYNEAYWFLVKQPKIDVKQRNSTRNTAYINRLEKLLNDETLSEAERREIEEKIEELKSLS